MNGIRSLRFLRAKSNTLFMRLVLSFFFIIVLLVSLTSYAVSVSKSSVRHEIVKYNSLMLHNTTENYEKHLEMIKRQMYLFYFSDRVQQLERDSRYTSFADVMKDIQSWVANPNLFIENIVFYSKNRFVLEKDTSTKAETMFTVFLTSEPYPLDFWNKQFDAAYTNRLFPAASFYTGIFRSRQSDTGELIPLVFKRVDNHDFYMVVFLNASKMYEAFHQSINEDFTIYDGDGQTIYRRSAFADVLPFDSLKSHEGSEFVRDGQYHFHMTAAASGMTYLTRVPETVMANQTRLNLAMVIVIAVVVVFSVLISLLLAARIHNPFKKLIDSIRGAGDADSFRSNIEEFDMIGRQLVDKKRLQKQWSVIHLLKDIRVNENDAAKLVFSDRPFVFLLFHVVERKDALRSPGLFQRWMYYIRVFIEDKLSRPFPDALTFQLEYNQILSLVFLHRTEELEGLLGEMKAVFDQDRDTGIITITVTSVFEHYRQVNEAYKEVLERVGERQLIDETQIIASSSQAPTALGMTPEQDIHFRANLKEGNRESLQLLIGGIFSSWRGKEMPAAAWQRFAESMADRIRQVASSSKISESKVNGILADAEEKISHCVTETELERLILEWLMVTCEAIEEKTERKDAVTSFVMDYVRDHLAEEISLDSLAEKLNLSSGYLSTYFKEKTGMNIVDYVNETRTQKAASLLLDSRLKIQEVAEAVGYRNITSFNRMFKRFTGLRPSDYRKSRQADPER
ncbi:helix-turn-helix domain-containing protein [Paenibacillus aurantius]|uniref:Helix-turn-helix domain-containing protein n=1 Tax=Paenibacillus aurantius TaxID=2918900 RepID=A0AA96LEV3_9BACL|nr:helix-turn-helix domain-containing protein [Paenibacillus aurantius]WNQ12532.1 helix-turn-helix domain-containing protein [Paenibacillus aurantius]